MSTEVDTVYVLQLLWCGLGLEEWWEFGWTKRYWGIYKVEVYIAIVIMNKEHPEGGTMWLRWKCRGVTWWEEVTNPYYSKDKQFDGRLNLKSRML